MTVTLGSAFSSTCFLRKVGKRISSSSKHTTTSQLSYVLRRISRITLVVGLVLDEGLGHLTLAHGLSLFCR